MTELQTVAHGNTMSSREIAQLTGKRHDNVKRDIETMLSALEINALKFEHIYRDGRNRKQSEHLLPKRETLILISGYSAPLRAKIVDRWIELEETEAELIARAQAIGGSASADDDAIDRDIARAERIAAIADPSARAFLAERGVIGRGPERDAPRRVANAGKPYSIFTAGRDVQIVDGEGGVVVGPLSTDEALWLGKNVMEMAMTARLSG